TGVKGISKMGRATQGVTVMKLRSGDSVSAVAVVADTDSDIEADVAGNGAGPEETGQAELPEASNGAAPAAEPKTPSRKPARTTAKKATAKKPARKTTTKKTAKKTTKRKR